MPILILVTLLAVFTINKMVGLSNKKHQEEYLRDIKDVPLQSGTGIVISKNYHGGEVGGAYIGNDGEHLYEVGSDEYYDIKIKIEGLTKKIKVNEEFFDSVEKGQQLSVKYMIGKNTGKFYLQEYNLL